MNIKKLIKEEISKITEKEEEESWGGGLAPSPEHPKALESPLEERDFNLDQIDTVATKLHETRTELHNLVMWAMDQGYDPER